MRAAVILAAALVAGAPVAAMARADEASPNRANSAEDAVVGMNGALAVMAERLDLAPPDHRAGFEPLLQAVFAGSPGEPEAAFHIGFDAALGGAESPAPVFSDAAACQAAWPGKAVVRFERLNLEGAVGHHCVVAGPQAGETEDGAYVGWAMLGDYRLQTPLHNLSVRLGAATASEDYDEAAVLGEAHLASLTELSRRFGVAAAELARAAQ